MIIASAKQWAVGQARRFRSLAEYRKLYYNIFGAASYYIRENTLTKAVRSHTRRFGVLLLAIVSTGTISPCSAPDSVTWSTAVAGLRLGVGLDTKASASTLHVILQNVGSIELTLLLGGNQGRGDAYSFQLAVTAPDGRRYPIASTSPAYYSTGGFVTPITATIEPKGVRTFAYPLSQLVCFTKTGNVPLGAYLQQHYTLHVSLDVLAISEINSRRLPVKTSPLGMLVTPEFTFPTNH